MQLCSRFFSFFSVNNKYRPAIINAHRTNKPYCIIAVIRGRKTSALSLSDYVDDIIALNGGVPSKQIESVSQ